jgi:hypothetical protein
MKVLLSCLVVLLFASCRPDDDPPGGGGGGQLFEYHVAPSATHAVISTFNNDHYVFLDTRTTLKNKLFVFLPGTSGSPFFYTQILKQAAAYGFHAIGLMYPNGSELYVASATSLDNTQFGKCRLEIFNGTNQSAGVTVDADNCIKTRLIKLLEYLARTYPTQNWQQFLSGGDVTWDKLTVAGHSQGGGHAWYISKLVPLDRAIAFSSIDWNGLLNRSAAWITQPGSTPVSRVYSFNSPSDQIFAYNNVQVQLSDFGLAGPAVDIDLVASPYSNSHTLITRAVPALNVLVPDHNVTCLDPYLPRSGSGEITTQFLRAWEYLVGK